MANVIPMSIGANNQSVDVKLTETGAREPVYRLFGNVWEEQIGRASCRERV